MTEVRRSARRRPAVRGGLGARGEDCRFELGVSLEDQIADALLRAGVGGRSRRPEAPALAVDAVGPRGERMPPATSIARHARVHSSTTVRHFKPWPLAHVSNTKSYAQTWPPPRHLQPGLTLQAMRPIGAHDVPFARRQPRLVYSLNRIASSAAHHCDPDPLNEG